MENSALLIEAEELATSIKQKLASGPLMDVAQRLTDLLDEVVCAVSAGHPRHMLAAAIVSVRATIQALPTQFRDRFYLDARLIQSILQQWSSAEVRFSGYVIPHYTNEWGYYRLSMPSEDLNVAHVVCVATFRGTDQISDIDLGDYPWLVHELIHDCFYRVQYRFTDRINLGLQQRLRSLQLRTSADARSAHQRAIEHINSLKSFWSPTPNQVNWSHEVAADVASFLVLGSAYTACFRRLLAKRSVDIDRVTRQHPSYRIRAQALAVAAERLSWPDELWGLQEALKARPVSGNASVYGDVDIVNTVVEASIQICDELKLPRMSSARIDRLILTAHATDSRPTGIDVIAMASLQKHLLSPGEYAEWHRDTIQRLT